MLDRHGHRHGADRTPTIITKRVDEVVPDDGSQQDDDDLYFPVVANGLYALEGLILVHSEANNSFVYEWIEPAGTTYQIQVSTQDGISNLTETLGERAVATVAGVTQSLRFVGTIQVGPVGGIFQFRWR